MLFHEYYKNWILLYKENAVRGVTLSKYLSALQWVQKIAPNLMVENLTRTNYQLLLNEYAKTHEKQTTTDFHHLLKACILDAIDDGYITKDPTRRVTIKGKPPVEKKDKYLNQFELHKLLEDLNLDYKNKYEWLIYIGAKTGMRFSEILAITPEDFDAHTQTFSINKTYDYKNGTGFVPTKNQSSNRRVQVDWQTANKFYGFIQGKDAKQPVFITMGQKIYNATVNDILSRHCKNVNIPEISYHGLRHTHASVLLYAGVSVASISKRLGHADIATTQKVYLHIIKEMDSFDTDVIMKTMSLLG